MTLYLITATVWESTEPIIRDANDVFETRVAELKVSGDLKETIREFQVQSNKPEEELLLQLQEFKTKAITLFRNKSSYPHLDGKIVIVEG